MFWDNLLDFFRNEEAYLKKMVASSEVARQTTEPPEEPRTPEVNEAVQEQKLIRDKYNISEEEWEEAKHILYGEISDRPLDKQKLEAETILNTALNRMGEYERYTGKPHSLKDVLTMPNQYQAYMPDDETSLYSQSKRGEYAVGGERRLQAIDDVFNRAKSGGLQDNTNGAYFYVHKPDGSIEYDDQKSLYAE